MPPTRGVARGIFRSLAEIFPNVADEVGVNPASAASFRWQRHCFVDLGGRLTLLAVNDRLLVEAIRGMP